MPGEVYDTVPQACCGDAQHGAKTPKALARDRTAAVRSATANNKTKMQKIA
jgi:hypothetical protein